MAPEWTPEWCPTFTSEPLLRLIVLVDVLNGLPLLYWKPSRCIRLCKLRVRAALDGVIGDEMGRDGEES